MPTYRPHYYTVSASSPSVSFAITFPRYVTYSDIIGRRVNTSVPWTWYELWNLVNTTWSIWIGHNSMAYKLNVPLYCWLKHHEHSGHTTYWIVAGNLVYFLVHCWITTIFKSFVNKMLAYVFLKFHPICHILSLCGIFYHVAYNDNKHYISFFTILLYCFYTFCISTFKTGYKLHRHLEDCSYFPLSI